MSEPTIQKASGRGSVPEVEAERYGNFHAFELGSFIRSVHIVIKEQISLSLLRDGGLQSLELKGDMNLQISDPASAHLKITLSQPPNDAFGTALQFKQHPNVAKFAPGNAPKVVALKEPGRAFPIGGSLAVLKWRYVGTDESNVPLSSKFDLVPLQNFC